jgi:hypothetical protein
MGYGSTGFNVRRPTAGGQVSGWGGAGGILSCRRRLAAAETRPPGRRTHSTRGVAVRGEFEKHKGLKPGNQFTGSRVETGGAFKLWVN